MKRLLKISNSVLQIYSVMPNGMLFTKIKKKKKSVGEVSATHFPVLHTLLLQIISSSRKILYIFRLQHKPKMSINRDYCVSGINCAAIKWNDAEINSHRFYIKWPKYLQDTCWITCFTNFHSPSHKPEVSARPFIYILTNPYQNQQQIAQKHVRRRPSLRNYQTCNVKTLHRIKPW